MLPRPTAEPMADRMKPVCPENCSRGAAVDCSVRADISLPRDFAATLAAAAAHSCNTRRRQSAGHPKVTGALPSEGERLRGERVHPLLVRSDPVSHDAVVIGLAVSGLEIVLQVGQQGAVHLEGSHPPVSYTHLTLPTNREV